MCVRVCMSVCLTAGTLQEFTRPQEEVLYHVIAQPNSRDAVHSMLGMNRQVSPTR